MGPIACLLSATAFGVLAIFAKLAYDEGVEVDALLLLRFGLAALVLATVARAQRAFAGLALPAVVAGLLMGAIGYAAQSGLYFAALTRVDASQVALVFCVYPVLVMVVAVLTRRERASARRTAALAVALVGVALVLGGTSTGAFDPVGAALSLGSAAVYTAYILVGDRVSADPIAVAALVCCGATGTLLLWSAVRGAPDLGFAARGWLWLGLVALVSTVAAIILFLAGLARVGPSTASLLSLLEPVVTVGSAALVLGEALTLPQAVGGALVLLSVVIGPGSHVGGRASQGSRIAPGSPSWSVRRWAAWTTRTA